MSAVVLDENRWQKVLASVQITNIVKQGKVVIL